MPKGIYPRTKPAGFLHPQNDHRVHVFGVGEVYRGHNRRQAIRAYETWAKFSQHGIGRATGKPVTHRMNGTLIAEHRLVRVRG